MTKIKSIPINAKSESVNVSSNGFSEIDRLSGEVKRQREKADFWDKWNIRFLFVTAFAAGCLAVTAIGVSRSNKLAGELSNRLEKAKDARLQDDLKSKDREIAVLNDHAASLELQALNLRKQLLMQGPRANLLVGNNRHVLVSALKHFPEQKIDVRRNAFIIEVNGKPVSSSPIGDDTEGFATALISLFKEATWNVLADDPPLCSFTGRGIVVGIATNASEKTESVARALIVALSSVPLSVSGPARLPEPRFRRVGANTVAPLDSTTIVLEVMSRE